MVGSAACRAHVRTALARTPFEFAAADDAYAAITEVCRRPLAYRVVILCLNSTYREELALISTVRRRFRHVDVYLAQTDGRHAALAEAVRLGAVGLVSEDGLHRIDDPPAAEPTNGHGGVADVPSTGGAPTGAKPPPQRVVPSDADIRVPADDVADSGLSEPHLDDLAANGEAVLTADELRALLHDHPTLPPASGAGG